MFDILLRGQVVSTPSISLQIWNSDDEDDQLNLFDGEVLNYTTATRGSGWRKCCADLNSSDRHPKRIDIHFKALPLGDHRNSRRVAFALSPHQSPFFCVYPETSATRRRSRRSRYFSLLGGDKVCGRRNARHRGRDDERNLGSDHYQHIFNLDDYHYVSKSITVFYILFTFLPLSHVAVKMLSDDLRVC